VLAEEAASEGKRERSGSSSAAASPIATGCGFYAACCVLRRAGAGAGALPARAPIVSLQQPLVFSPHAPPSTDAVLGYYVV
jgi:hypothetical protein